MTQITAEIREKLLSLRDEKYLDFQCRLMPTVPKQTVIGVRVPELRKMAKELLKNGNGEEYIRTLPHDFYEENNLHGFILCGIKDYPTALKEINRFLPYVNNWATCDMMRPKAFEKNADKLIPEIRRWIAAGDVYTVRFGIEMLMNFFLDDRFRKEQADLVAMVTSEEYYVRMMAAWYFATALAKQYDSIIPYLENRRLDPAVQALTIKKACESFRITDDRKAYLRSLK